MWRRHERKEAPDRSRRPAWVSLMIAAQFELPALLLIARWTTGEVWWYGAGWQMFSG